MENENNTLTEQPQYINPAPAPAPNFLPVAIVAVALAAIPFAGIASIILGAKNKKKIKNYLAEGGPKTAMVKVSSILSTVGLWFGLGMTIYWAIYFSVIAIAAISSAAVASF